VFELLIEPFSFQLNKHLLILNGHLLLVIEGLHFEIINNYVEL
jgi:hypothetical protein